MLRHVKKTVLQVNVKKQSSSVYGTYTARLLLRYYGWRVGESLKNELTLY